MSNFMFEEFKNPDGSYNGIKMFAQLTRMPEEEVKRIWDKVKSDRKNTRPKCFGDYPLRYPLRYLHIQAERCCNDCKFNHTCFEATRNGV